MLACAAETGESWIFARGLVEADHVWLSQTTEAAPIGPGQSHNRTKTPAASTGV